MFNNCNALTTLDLSSFYTPQVENMSYMFGNCTLLQTLYLSNFDTSNATDKTDMVSGCSALQTVVIKTEYSQGIEELLSEIGLNTKSPDTPDSGYTTYTRTASYTITHLTNVYGDIGTFCETNGGIFDGYIKTASTDCICKVVQSNTLNSKIVGIICDKDKFASHGDVLVRVVPGTYNLGDILCPDITGKARVATETEKQFMMINAVPRPKITAFTDDQSLVACFIV
jgi:surface protein